MAQHAPKVSAEIIPAPVTKDPPAHHIGSPPTAFRNPWQSAQAPKSLFKVLNARFSPKRNFIPVPQNRDELVPIRTPDWGEGIPGLKATWIGHASFLIETSTSSGSSRGVRIFLDPAFSERVGPYN